jgi:hypothetical protein
MTINIDQTIKWVCPLCEKQLANEEYHKAIKKLDIQAREKYEKEVEHIKIKSNKELEEVRVKTEQNIKQYYDKLLHNKEKEKEVGLIDQRKMFEQFMLQKEEQIKLIRNEQTMYKEKYEKEIDNQYRDKFSRLTNIITEKDTQMKRAEEEIEILRKKLTKNQSELTGEVGELNLYKMLTEAFHQEQDYFERSKRGTAMGDIIHYIKTPNGILETKIVYDNKSSSTVTRSDIEKAQRYKKIHNTNHVIIVSSNLPKRDIENGLIGQKEGITLVHPDIVVEIVKQIRHGIIKISNYAKSNMEKESKEAELYDFITSDNFLGVIEENKFEYYHILKEQETEEKDHQILWKKRKNRFKKIMDNINFLTHQIDMITTTTS